MIKELFQLLIDCIKSPKKYLNNIIDNNQTQHQLLLLVLIGIIIGLNNDLLNYFRGDKSLLSYLLHSILLGGMFGWVGLYFLSYVVALVGMLFKSNTHGDKIINIIAYSYIPILLVFIVLIIEFITYSVVGFTSNINFLIRLFAIIKLLVIIYCFIIMVIGVSKVQGLSIIKGFLTLFIPTIVFISLLTGAMYLFK